jgi:hypothetical protein
MADDIDTYEVQLDGAAKNALSEIVTYLRRLTGKDERLKKRYNGLWARNSIS